MIIYLCSWRRNVVESLKMERINVTIPLDWAKTRVATSQGIAEGKRAIREHYRVKVKPSDVVQANKVSARWVFRQADPELT
jgi:hypothetical protein